jgi:hypothetical protein
LADAAPAIGAAAPAVDGGADLEMEAAVAAAGLAARMAKLVQELGGADADAAVAAANHLAEGGWDAAACAALVACGAMNALLPLLRAGPPPPALALAHAAQKALYALLRTTKAVRLSAIDAGAIADLMHLLAAEPLQSEAATALHYIMQEECAARDKADSAFVGQLVALLRDERAVLDVVVPLLRVLLALAAHNAACRTLVWDAQGVPLLASLLVRGDVHARHDCGKHKVTISDLASRVLLLLQSPNGGFALEKLCWAMYDAGVFAAVVPLLGAATGKCAALFGREAELEAPGWVLAAAYAVDDLKPIIRQYLANLPGALAGLALGARSGITYGSQETLARFLEQLTKDPTPARKTDPRPEPTAFESGQWLLDPHFAVCAMLELRIRTGSDTARYTRMCTVLKSLLAAAPTAQPNRCDWRSTTGARVLVQPLAEQRLSAAVSAALLLGEDMQFRQVLRGGVQLDTLLAAFASCDEGSTPARWSYDWTRRALHTAVKTAVVATQLGVTAGGSIARDEPASKRQRSLGATLRREDVNVRRRDSTVLLIAGQPIYVNGELLEGKSVVLKDLLNNVQTPLDHPIPLPLPGGVSADQHYAIFRAAVEHAYTGMVAGLEDASLLPLWCLGDHLQMDELRAWCIEHMLPLMRKDGDMLEAAWAAALARPCDALCDACVSAWLVSVAAAAASDTAPLELLARVQAGCAAGVSLTAQAASVLRKAL